VAGVVFRLGRRADHVLAPIVEAADADQEEERGRDEDHGHDRRALEDRKALDRPQHDHQPEGEGGTDDRHPDGA
jgi:hypothetical protein